MAYKALRGPLASPAALPLVLPPPLAFSQSLSSGLPQGFCTCSFLCLLSSSALFTCASQRLCQYAISFWYCSGYSLHALNVLYLLNRQLLGHKLPD